MIRHHPHLWLLAASAVLFTPLSATSASAQHNNYTQVTGSIDQGVVFPSAPTGPARQDPAAISEIRLFQQLMGLSVWDDMKGSGTIIFNTSDTSSYNASLWIRNQDENRLDVQLPKGTRSTRVTATHGTVQHANGQMTLIDAREAVTGLVGFPIFTETSFPDASTIVVDDGIVSVDGMSLRRVSVERPWKGKPKDASGNLLMSVIDFYFDSQTHLLKKTATAAVGPGGAIGQLIEVVSYDDYQTTNGATLPFAYHATLNGQLLWSLQLKQINLHVGLSDSDFHF